LQTCCIIQEGNIWAQQQENKLEDMLTTRRPPKRPSCTNRLSLNRSFLEVGPFSVVPLIDNTIVELSSDKKTCPLKPSLISCQPKGKLYNADKIIGEESEKRMHSLGSIHDLLRTSSIFQVEHRHLQTSGPTARVYPGFQSQVPILLSPPTLWGLWDFGSCVWSAYVHP